ncbi:MAG: LysM domain-containing protein [Caldilineaceae bacterium]
MLRDGPISQPVYAQAAPQHSLQLASGGFSIVQVEIDGTVVFRGILAPNEIRQWRGQTIALTIESNLPATVTYDGMLQGTVAQAGQRITLYWPNPGPAIERGLSRPPAIYTVQPGDTLFLIAQQFGSDVDMLLRANQLTNVDLIYAGTRFLIPGSDGALPAQPLQGQFQPMTGPGMNGDVTQAIIPRATVTDRLTAASQAAPPSSPFYQTTWLTYYGRPAVPIMGILGEYDIDALTHRLKAEAAAYDLANGEELAVLPAYHLVYGMATKAPNDDGSHLIFLEDATVEAYIQRAQKEGFAVILDIQIGALSPADALAYGLPWLDYANVHLALDPEFAMAHAGQFWPGDPIGYVTAAQINAAQAVMQRYIEEHNITGQRVLLVHQFLDTMIENKRDLDWSTYDRLVLTLSADGWGGPWGKISKYNTFMDQQTQFTAFKLFYRWDEPLMTPREALGIDGYGEQGYIEVTPNLIIYQ